MSTVLISFPGEAATGVVCPRETGEMKIDDCRECPNFKAGMGAIVRIWTDKKVVFRSPSERAGVICPKETGEMKTEDCRECPNFNACLNALKEELGEVDMKELSQMPELRGVTW